MGPFVVYLDGSSCFYQGVFLEYCGFDIVSEKCLLYMEWLVVPVLCDYKGMISLYLNLHSG